MGRKNTPVTIRIYISILSFILFLALLEIGLRITGNFYFNFNKVISKKSISDDFDRNFYRILCIGDSYTFQAGGGRESSYPSQLQTIFSEDFNKKVRIINGGICEANSYQVLKSLSRLIKIHKPDYVILLVGAANTFNLFGYELDTRGIKDAISNLRICNMFRILKTNLKGELLKWKLRQHIAVPIKEQVSAPNNTESKIRFGSYISYKELEAAYKSEIDLNPRNYGAYLELARLYEELGEYQKTEAVLREAIEKNPNNTGAYFELGQFYLRGRNYKEAEAIFKKSIEINPRNHNADSYKGLGDCYNEQDRRREAILYYKKAIEINPLCVWAYGCLAEVYIKERKYASGLEFLCRAIELNPEDFGLYYLLGRTLELQSKHGSNYVLEILQRITKNKPHLKENKIFTNYLTFFAKRYEWEKKIDRWLRQDLEEIVKLCKENNIKLIIQNYPYPYSLANKTLREVALNYSLPFVDNYSLFEQLLNKSNREEYFKDDDHCTDKGASVMAKNVYNIIIKEGAILK